MTPEAMRRLFAYHYWASEKVWDCILSLTDKQFTQSIEYSVGSIRNHVVHVMSASGRWIQRLQGVAVKPHLDFEDYPTRALAKAKWDAMKAEMLTYIESLNQAQLDKQVEWELPAHGIRAANTRWEVLLQVVNHGTDHRAQILAMLHHHFGVQTVEQDLIFYLVEDQ
jgi:uncharacterized damage-inducible protein DinB